MLKKIGLFVLIVSTQSIAMSPVQLTQLQQQFRNALAQENIAQAQQIIGQLQSGGRGAYANAWQLELNAKNDAIEARKRAAADSVRAKADAERLAQQKKAAEEEARKREAQAREEKARLEKAEAQLQAELARTKGATDSNAKLLGEIHQKNTQIYELTQQMNKLQQDIAAQRLSAETAALEAQGKCEREIAASAKKCEDATSALRSRYEQLLAEAQKAGQPSPALEGQLQQLKSQVSQLETQLAQANKQNENLKQGMPSQKANEELRLRLSEAEKALQAQTKKAQDCEQQKIDLNQEFKKSSDVREARLNELNKKREELESRLKNLTEEKKKIKGADEADLAKQAQQSEIIRKKQDELYAANQTLEKQVRELTSQLQQAKKEVEDLKNEDNNKADRIFTLETDAEAEKQLKEKAVKELESIKKEVQSIGKATGAACEQYEKQIKELKQTAFDAAKKSREQLLKAQEETITANRNLNDLRARNQSVVSFANSLKRQKEIKPKDIQDLLDILIQR